MRQILLFLLLITTNQFFSQVGKVEVIPKSILLGTAYDNLEIPPRIEYYNTEEGRFYILLYLENDIIATENVRGVIFKADEKEIEYVYEFFKSAFENEDIRSLELGEYRLTIWRTKFDDSISITVKNENENSGNFHLTLEQLDKLFGIKTSPTTFKQ